MLVIDSIHELNLCCRMLEVLRKRIYTIPELSSLLGMSMYSGHFYKIPLFKKLLNEGVFILHSNSKPVKYMFDPEKLVDAMEKSNLLQRLRKVMRIRTIIRDEI